MSEALPTEFTSGAVTQRLSTGLAKIGMAIKSQAWRSAGPARLTPTQGQAVTLLRARGEMRLDALAAELGVTAPTASDAVGALVRKGLVLRARSAADGRAVSLSLTPEGTALADEVADWPDFLARAIDVLDPGEQTVLLRSMSKIIRQLQVAGDIPVQRMCVTCVHFRPNVHAGPHPHHCAFVDAAFGERELRLDCHDQAPAAPAEAATNWARWTATGGESAPQGDLR